MFSVYFLLKQQGKHIPGISIIWKQDTDNPPLLAFSEELTYLTTHYLKYHSRKFLLPKIIEIERHMTSVLHSTYGMLCHKSTDLLQLSMLMSDALKLMISNIYQS